MPLPRVVTVRVPRVTYNRFTQLGVRPGEAVLADLGRLSDTEQITSELVASLEPLSRDTVPVMLTVPQMDKAGVTPTVESLAERLCDGPPIGNLIGLVVAVANGDGVPRRTGRVKPKITIPVAPDERVPTGDDLRAMRTQRGWTQQELAAQAGLLDKVISEVETGVRQREQTRAYLARILTSRS